jgi:hypothetical protein
MKPESPEIAAAPFFARDQERRRSGRKKLLVS